MTNSSGLNSTAHARSTPFILLSTKYWINMALSVTSARSTLSMTLSTESSNCHHLCSRFQSKLFALTYSAIPKAGVRWSLATPGLSPLSLPDLSPLSLPGLSPTLWSLSSKTPVKHSVIQRSQIKLEHVWNLALKDHCKLAIHLYACFPILVHSELHTTHADG